MRAIGRGLEDGLGADEDDAVTVGLAVGLDGGVGLAVGCACGLDSGFGAKEADVDELQAAAKARMPHATKKRVRLTLHARLFGLAATRAEWPWARSAAAPFAAACERRARVLDANATDAAGAPRERHGWLEKRHRRSAAHEIY